MSFCEPLRVCVLQGISVERVCTTLRMLSVLHVLAKDRPLVILCDVQAGTKDSMEVTLVSTHTGSDEISLKCCIIYKLWVIKMYLDEYYGWFQKLNISF